MSAEKIALIALAIAVTALLVQMADFTVNAIVNRRALRGFFRSFRSRSRRASSVQKTLQIHIKHVYQCVADWVGAFKKNTPPFEFAR